MRSEKEKMAEEMMDGLGVTALKGMEDSGNGTKKRGRETKKGTKKAHETKWQKL